MTIMDSMATNELDGDIKVFKAPKTGTARIVRISRGAGVMPQHVVEVINTFVPFSKVAKKIAEMSKGGMMDPRKMQGKNGQMNMKALTSMLPPV